jgi:hypothetical protein
MRFRKIALALFACLALGAFAANAAQAAEGDGWTIGTTENQTTSGTLIPSGTHERVSCKKHGTTSFVISSTHCPPKASTASKKQARRTARQSTTRRAKGMAKGYSQ